MLKILKVTFKVKERETINQQTCSLSVLVI